ncbi:MAG TPA: hypothetical protein VFS67_27745 [Polyangiaceae bacterium]|jgi:hypothetical protein|nr:hypothetical protein [Polyangiaceae bacterium]
MQRDKDRLRRRASTAVAGTALALVACGMIARAEGSELLFYVLTGMGLCLVLGFWTSLTLRRSS